MDEQQALDHYLHPELPRRSSFWAARNDARQATGRDGQGDVVDEPRSGNWLGAVGYLLLLDQLGTAVRPKGGATYAKSVPALIRTLERFSPGDPTSDGREAIYALRCALAHDFSLFNDGRGKVLRRHEFALHRGTGRLMQLPARRWQGVYTALQDPTEVSLRRLGDLVERVCEAVLHAHQQGQLEIAPGLSPADLAQRYTFGIVDPSPTDVPRRGQDSRGRSLLKRSFMRRPAGRAEGGAGDGL